MSGNQDAFQKIMNLGHSAAWDQMWDRAAAYYRQALEEFPDNPSALSNLGLALFELRDYENSLKVYQRAAVTSPQDPVPFEKMGKISERLGRIKEAVQAYTQAADLYLRARDVDKSINNWMQVLRLQESLMVRTRLAMIYDRVGRKPEAVTEYLAAASLMQRGGDVARATQAAEYALNLLPQSMEAQQALARLRANQPLPVPVRPRGGTGPVRMAEVRQMETAASLSATPDPLAEARQAALVQLAALLFDQEEESVNAQAARRGATPPARGSGGSPTPAEQTRVMLHLSQAIDFLTKSDDAQAAEELARGMEAGLKHPAASYILGLLTYAKDPKLAMRHLQESVKNPELAIASYILMGKTRQASGSLAEAAAAYLQALSLADSLSVAGEDADELRQLYEPLIEMQARETNTETQKALCDSIQNQLVRPNWLAHLRLARQQLPSQPEGNPPLPLAEMLLESRSGQVVETLAHIRLLAAQNKIGSAMEEAYYALEYAPTYLPLHIQIGELLLKEGQVQDATDKFLLVADLYTLRGESPQAIRLYNRIIEVSPMDLSVRTRLIELLLAQNKSDMAVQQYIRLAETYYQLGELDNARQSYTSALRVAQQSRGSRDVVIEILYKIADMDLQRLDWRNAIRVFEQIRTLEPDDLHSRARLVDLNYRLGQEGSALSEVDAYISTLENSNQHNRAVEFLIEILAEHADSIAIRRRLAEVHQRGGDSKKAIEQLEAISRQQITQGDRAAAVTTLQAILQFNPSNAADYQQAIQQLQRAR